MKKMKIINSNDLIGKYNRDCAVSSLKSWVMDFFTAYPLVFCAGIYIKL